MAPAMFVGVPIDDLVMHPFTPLPTEGDFLAAIRRRIREKAAISQKPEIRMLLEHNVFGVDMVFIL